MTITQLTVIFDYTLNNALGIATFWKVICKNIFSDKEKLSIGFFVIKLTGSINNSPSRYR